MKLTIPELVERHPAEWAVLSQQQRDFVIEYIGTGFNGQYNPLTAAKIAYPNVKTPTAWSARLLQNKRIKKIIALHLGLTETEVLFGDIKALVKRSKRKGANLDVLVAPWLRIAAALEKLVVQENSNA